MWPYDDPMQPLIDRESLDVRRLAEEGRVDRSRERRQLLVYMVLAGVGSALVATQVTAQAPWWPVVVVGVLLALPLTVDLVRGWLR